MTDSIPFDDVEDTRPAYTPCLVEKATLLPRLRAALLPESLPLDQARKSLAIDPIRSELIDHCGDKPGLCEFDADLLSPVAAIELCGWPAWYVRVPADWQDDIPRLAAADGLSPYLSRHDYNPWTIAQWIAIVSEYREGGWEAEARRIEVDEADLTLTFSKAVRSDAGLLVLFECGDSITLTAYPIDDGLIGCLQASGVASCRHPLFDASLAEVQAMTRALEDGIEPPRDADAIQLTVSRVGKRPTPFIDTDWLERLRASRGPYISHETLYGADWGPLHGVFVDGLPAAWLEQGVDVLQLTLPYNVHGLFEDEPPEVNVVFAPAEGEAPDTVLLTLTRGVHLCVVQLRLDEPVSNRAVRTMAAEERCRLALVNMCNGRPFPMDVDWPDMSLPEVSPLPSAASRDVLMPHEHPRVGVLATELMERLGQTILLYQSGVRCTDSLTAEA